MLVCKNNNRKEIYKLLFNYCCILLEVQPEENRIETLSVSDHKIDRSCPNTQLLPHMYYHRCFLLEFQDNTVQRSKKSEHKYNIRNVA